MTKFSAVQIALPLLAVAMLLRLFFMSTSLMHLPATSDEASLALLAKMIWNGAFPLLFMGQPYQFPIEAYVMAPLVEWMPRNAFGVRYQAFLLGLVSIFGFLAIVRAALPSGSRWPAALIVLFPSAYLLMLTSAYAPPQYSMSITLAWISIYAVVRSRTSSHKYLLLMVAGFSCGLGVSNHLLTVTVSAGVSALVVCCGSIHKALRGSVVFSLGVFIGAIPYFLALWFVPGAYENLPGSVDVAGALLRMVDPALTETLPGAMGVKPVLFPDFREHLGGQWGLRKLFAALYLLLFCALLVQRGMCFFLAIKDRQWPKLELVDLGLIASLLALGLFAFHRATGTSYRYLLPAVWCFPFILGHAYHMFKGRGRTVIGAGAVILALFNFTVSAKVISEWRKPGQIEKYADTPQIKTLLETLHAKAITHCYASFWLAYRITFESDENIICSLPYNERFPHWPIPYKEEVDQRADAVYILTQTFGARLTALSFQQQLKSYGVTAKVSEVNPFRIYYGFDFPPFPAGKERVLSPEKYTLHTNIGEKEPLSALQDGSFKTRWISSQKQEKGQWIGIDLKRAERVSGVTLFPLSWKSLSPTMLTIDGYEVVDGLGRWRRLEGPVRSSFQPLRFVNSHPVYQEMSQHIRFDPVRIRALRIEIAVPRKEVKWGLAELEISIIDDDS